VKIAYDGRDFMGSQRQPDLLTVESEVLRALTKIEAIESVQSARFKAASRTDRGVSALRNVVAFDTTFRRSQLLRALNSASDIVFFYGWAEVPRAFTPRRARRRWYRYHLPLEGLDPRRVVACAKLFEGEHDFRRFCKSEGRSTVKKIERVEVSEDGGFLVIDLYAREFLRNMVRRMVAAMSEVGRGRASLDEVMRSLSGEDVSFGLAPAENLVLMDIEYDLDFSIECTPTLLRKMRIYSEDVSLRLALIGDLTVRCSRQL